jgi:hypothetical protein
VRWALLLCAALLVGAAVLLRADPAGARFVGHPEFHAVDAQLTFDAVVKVPRCADYYGTGRAPAEGHAAVFVRLSATDMYFVGELSFDDSGWVADDVVLGDVADHRHFTLYLYAVSGADIARFERQPRERVRPTRLLDVITVVRDDGPDTC